MAFKDILVHIDEGGSCPSRLAVAVSMAKSHGAHLVGLHVRHDLQLPGAITADIGGQLAQVYSQHLAGGERSARLAFEKAAADAGLSCEWRDVSGDLLKVAAMHARYADLVVVGQTDGDDGTVASERRLADHLVLAAGTPVLVVPSRGRFATVGERVLLAWNAGREARRSVSDALPILVKAKRVNVLAINPKDGTAGHGDLPGADIGLHLARHGANAVCQSITADDIDVGNMLLSRAADENADLLVMGAYGHSRLTEVLLGGATRHILAHMTLPVLLSH
ncbi:MAG TPA: universal stress protein [Rhodospirillaceae bacterium]|nr:universal stress protein [Rhodospirillaceae bacterium]